MRFAYGGKLKNFFFFYSRAQTLFHCSRGLHTCARVQRDRLTEHILYVCVCVYLVGNELTGYVKQYQLHEIHEQPARQAGDDFEIVAEVARVDDRPDREEVKVTDRVAEEVDEEEKEGPVVDVAQELARAH